LNGRVEILAFFLPKNDWIEKDELLKPVVKLNPQMLCGLTCNTRSNVPDLPEQMPDLAAHYQSK
jgi:hypothetical protein